jgi:hypothetical protein
LPACLRPIGGVVLRPRSSVVESGPAIPPWTVALAQPYAVMTPGCLASRTNVERTCTGWRFPVSVKALRVSLLVGFRIGGRSFIRTSGFRARAVGQVEPVWRRYYPHRP